MNQYPPPRARVKVQPRFFVILGILATIVVVAVLYTRGGITGGRQATALVEPMDQSNHYQGDVIIVRDETLVDAETITSIEFVAEEGALAYRGDVICQVYSAGFNQTEVNKLEQYRVSIKDIHKKQLESTIVDPQLEKINNDIAAYALEIRTIVQGTGTGSLGNLENQLSSSMTERKTYLQQKYPDNQTLTKAYDDETKQLRKIESWTSTYTADGECIVSFYTDGYEQAINLDTFDSISPQDARQVLSGVQPESDAVSRGRTPLYRTVNPNQWAVILLSKNADWSPMVDQVFKMQLDGYADFMVDATVRSSVRTGNDLLVRLDIESSVYPVLNIRSNRAVIGETLNGLRVPINSLVVQGEMAGVVTNDAGVEYFVPVQTLSRTDQYAFVVPLYDSTLQAGQRVNVY